MVISLISMVSILSIFICLILSIFLIFTRSEKKLANYFFAVFLLLTAIDLSGWVLINQTNYGSLFNALRKSLGALQMPCFLGFIVASCYSNFKLKKLDLLHTLPFCLYLFYCLPGNQLDFIKNEINSDRVFLSDTERTVSFFTAEIQYYLYIAVAIYILFRFKKIFQTHYSDSRSSVFRWLMQLVGISVFAHTLAFVRGLIGLNHYQTQYFAYLQIFGAFLVLCILTWITLKALLQPAIFRGIDGTLHKAAKHLEKDTAEDTEQSIKKKYLLDYMQAKQPYLNAELNLLDLSEQIGLTQRDLSELINQEFSMHFFDFINRYRVESAKNKLLENRSLTVLEILYAVGFNSKSSFNTAFKKHTRTTPTAFRKAHA